MNQDKLTVIEAIEEKQSVFCDLSDEIWGYAELSLKEYKSAAAYVRVLRTLGFETEERVAGIDTAFLGKYGQGRPVIGILGEFDALAGLSQKGGATEESPLVPGGAGHGCGHNMLGAGALAAAYGIKRYLETTGKPGTVIFYGTPGEEGGAGKAFMAKEGMFYGLDCALTWHPSDVNEVPTGTCNSCIQTLYKFKGIPAHAAADPEDGHSALDAVELMNVGVQYLREHAKPDARIHYAMIDGGGFSPNVVQSSASVLYMVRSVTVKDALKLQSRVDKIAEGAAMMTETSFEKVFIDGCSGTVPNHTLETCLYRNLEVLGAPVYTPDEWALAAALKATYPQGDTLPTMAAAYDKAAAAVVDRLSGHGTRALNDFISPLYTGDAFAAGSTDVGDVSWQTPTVQVYVAAFPSGAPGHSWQNVSCGRTSIGHKALLTAGKVLAMTAVDLLCDPGILSLARAEFSAATAAGYVSPIPDGETAKVIDLS